LNERVKGEATDASREMTIANIWEDDQIGDRRQHAEFLLQYLISRGNPATEDRGFVLNIDAEWGAGKSFFMERLRLHLEREHLVAYVDAWRDDFADDPLIAVLHAVREAFKKEEEQEGGSEAVAEKFKEMAGKGLRIVGLIGSGLLKRQAYRLVGDAVDELMDGESEEPVNGKKAKSTTEESEETNVGDDVAAAMREAFNHMGAVGQAEEEAFKQASGIINEFVISLRELAKAVAADKNAKAPIFILIDELDRCRPTYAIELLERVKHIFEAAGVVFIIATDTEQLAHSVKSVYGEGFNGRKYLQRFFDQSYLLPAPVGAKLIKTELIASQIEPSLFHKPYDLSLEDQIADMVSLFNLNSRETKRFFTTFTAAVKAQTFNSPIIAPYLSALVIAHIKSDDDLWAALTPKGHGSDSFSKIIGTRSLTPENRFAGKRPDGADLQYSMPSLLIQLLQILNRPLDFNFQRESGFGSQHGSNGWAREVMVQEWRDLNKVPKSYISKNSTLKNYPDLVISAGRLHLIDEKSKDEDE